MPITTTTTANEESTFVITCSFTDENSVAVVPSAVIWMLTDENGMIINNRSGVSVTSLASSIDIVLSGDDLAITGTSKQSVRILTVKATYDSTLGTGLPLKESLRFVVKNLVAI